MKWYGKTKPLNHKVGLSAARQSKCQFNATPYPTTSPRHKEITDAIAFHLAKDMAPVTTVAKDGFKKLIQTLDKRYCVPSRNYFSHVAIPALYNKCRETVETE